jgi:hypothetical protein
MRLSIGIILFAWLLPAAASEPTNSVVIPTDFDCRRATGPIKLDGCADEPAWTNAVVIETFVAYWAARPAKSRTRARLLWDDQSLYFYAEMEDVDLRAAVRDDNGPTWDDDVFELFFRPDEARANYYEFQVNALNTHFTELFPKHGRRAPGHEAVGLPFRWQTTVRLEGTLNNSADADHGWSAEGRIPWSDFARTSGKPKAGDTWRFALCRYDHSKNADSPDLSSCAPLRELSFHRLPDYCRLRFVQAP